MIKHFYSYLIEHDTLIIELDNLELSKKEKEHLISIAESSIHYVVIDTVLTELPQKEKKTFLDNLKSADHEKIWKHLFKKTDDIEEKIIKAVNNLKKQLKEDMDGLKVSR